MSDFVDLFSLPFMQRALLAALLTGLAAPAIGTFLVQRRLALLGDGIGHVAVTGVAIGLLTNTSPTWTAVVVAVLGAVLIDIARDRDLLDVEGADRLGALILRTSAPKGLEGDPVTPALGDVDPAGVQRIGGDGEVEATVRGPGLANRLLRELDEPLAALRVDVEMSHDDDHEAPPATDRTS